LKYIFLYKAFIIFFIFFSGCNGNKKKHNSPETEKDSISLWIKTAENESLPIIKRKQFLNKSYAAIMSAKKDTTVLRNLSTVAYRYLELNDTVNFKLINKKTTILAKKIKDTFALADSHWNYAIYYDDYEKHDSAYYHHKRAYNYFKKLDKQYYAAKMLYGMALIKNYYGDYSGSEVLLIQAISKYKPLNKNTSLYASYNQLGLIQGEIGEYNRALFYHNKALEYLKKIEDKSDYEASLNNIGIVYQDMGDHKKALEYFDKALENDSLEYMDVEHYARLLDNKAYSKYHLNDTIDLEKLFLRSLRIRDSVKNLDGVATVKLHLSEYYDKKKQYSKALHFANEASQLTNKIKSNELYLESLSLLSKLDTLNSKDHLARYIVFNDSLRNIERKTQNKFARISFETDEYIEETKRLSKQKIRILIIGLVIVLIVSLIYYIIIQRSRNKRLLLETEQRKANEQVYILTIEQQKRLEEEKTKERNRISQELHDGILGKLFGVRVDMGFLELDGSNDTLKQHEMFLEELQQIEQELREVSHKLNANFSSSEIDFSSILKQLLENKSRLGGFTYQLNNENVAWNQINEVIKVNLYRILQEALQNIIKYAKAKNVALDFSIEESNLIVRINDNGIGFDTKRRRKGIGIKNMKSRIKELKGVFSIQSEKDRGTTINFTILIQ